MHDQAVLDEGQCNIVHTSLKRSSRPPPGRLHVRRVIEERRVAVCNNPWPPPQLEECLGAVRVQGSTKVPIVRLTECGSSLGAVRVPGSAGASRWAQFPKVTNAFCITAERSRCIARRETAVAEFLAPQGKGAKVVVICMGDQRLGKSGNTGGAGTAAVMATTRGRGFR